MANALPDYRFRDEGWLSARAHRKLEDGSYPFNVYAVHLGEWLKGTDVGFLNYAEIASELACYVKQMGYTHIKLFPITEHMSYESLGFDVCGYFAPTARYGAPEDFMRFVDTMHEAGIGVLLDWIPSVFSRDAQTLAAFDGFSLYERSAEQDGCHFNVKKNEVASFLLSAVGFWIEKYHIDGFCMCRVQESDRELLAVIRRFVDRSYSDIILLSEMECDGYLTVGQTLERNSFLTADMPNPTFSDERQRAAIAKLNYACRMLFPGKKLSRMGEETGEISSGIGGERMTRNPLAGVQLFFAELNHRYLECPSLWSCRKTAVSPVRYGGKTGIEAYCLRTEEDVFLTVLNTTASVCHEYILEVPEAGSYEEILNSEDAAFGGCGVVNPSVLRAEGLRNEGRDLAIKITIPPFAACVFRLRK